MITLNLSTRAALKLLVLCERDGDANLAEPIMRAIETATGEGLARVRVENIARARFIDLVRIMRNYTGWELGDAKRWCDVVRGAPVVRYGHPHIDVPDKWPAKFDSAGEYTEYVNGRSNEVELRIDKARDMVAELHQVGVVATLVA